MDKYRGKTILLVEDESVTATLVSSQIKKFGYYPKHAATGEAAVEIIRSEEAIDLVLMDIDLGDGIDGTEAVRQIRQEKEVPIVFHTSHSEKEYVDRVKKITRYGYVIKNSGSFVLESSISMAFELFEANLLAKERKNYYKSLFQDNAFPILIIDPDTGSICDANNKAIEFYRSSVDELKNKNIFDINVLSSNEIYIEMEKARNKKNNFFHFKHKTAENKIIDVEVYSGPIFYQGKTRLCSFIYDASEKISLTKELAKKNEELVSYNEELRLAFEELKTLNKEIVYVKQETEKNKRIAENFLHIASEIIISLDTSGTITILNDSGHRLLGYAPGELIGKNWFRNCLFDEDVKTIAPYFKALMDGAENVTKSVKHPIKTKDGKKIEILWYNTILTDKTGKITGLLSSGQDITEREKLLHDKEILLRETHHRIKNNMATVDSMLSLQAEKVSDEECKNVLMGACSRVRSMMNLYDSIYRSKNVNNIDADTFISKLIDDILKNYSNDFDIKTNLKLDKITMDADTASSIAIIINELIINSIKHAFDQTANPEISVSLKKENKKIILIIGDNGKGLPDFLDLNENHGFGMELIQLLTEQINAQLEYTSKDGAQFTIIFEL